MPKKLDSEPWRGLKPEVADLIEPVLPAITGEILEAIGREVPEYARPLEGRFGEGIRTGVDEALLQFVALIRDPEAGRDPGREVYVALGKGEQRVGRTLDSLQAAYRIGARVAWRRIAEVGTRAALEPQALALLAEAIFAYIDELSADSVEGYAEAQAAVEDLRRRRRQELASLLLRESPVAVADLAPVAKAAEWRLPKSLAAAACEDRDLAAVAGRLPTDALVTVSEGVGCVFLPDPEGPGRPEELRQAMGRAVVAVGPTVEPAEAATSWRLARSLLLKVATRPPGAAGPLRVEDHLAELLLTADPQLTALLADRRLAPLGDLTPRARQRMHETALAHVRHHGNAVAMAAELGIHPQTARYRIARLKELFGENLDDPDTRFELELALRAQGQATI
ncbi:MAG TPA: helix-turn-helix domain-containing protein [Solirubrobacterales bacterium]|nr:helix-turn-helix domain-containing protein [Solirubrobacterales bacterium]